MVEHRHRQNLRPLQQLLGEGEIIGARLQVAAGVVVGHNAAHCPVANHGFEDFSGVGQGFGGGANGNHLSAHQPVAHIEQHHRKAFLGLPHQVVAEGGGGNGRVIHHGSFGGNGLQDPFPQFNGR